MGTYNLSDIICMIFFYNHVIGTKYPLALSMTNIYFFNYIFSIHKVQNPKPYQGIRFQCHLDQRNVGMICMIFKLIRIISKKKLI